MELTRELTIATLENGAIIERLEAELKDVLQDCANVNKDPESVREINLKIKVKPDNSRTLLLIGIETSTKLGKRYPVIAKAFLDEDTGTAIEPTMKQKELFTEDEQPIQRPIRVIGGRDNG